MKSIVVPAVKAAVVTAAFAAVACTAFPMNAYAQVEPESLIKAANQEGHLTIYTAMDPDNELKLTREFNKKYPDIKIDMLRLTGSQIITRLKAESGANRMNADIIVLPDAEETDEIHDLYEKYSPPNAANFKPVEKIDTSVVWPRAVGTWALCANAMTGKTPPKAWSDLLKPEYKGSLGEVTILTGGSGWIRSQFQRVQFGEDYWKKLAAQKPRVYSSGVPMVDAMIRGEVSVGALLANQAMPKVAEGAPLVCNFATDGVPAKGQYIGIAKTTKAPNAAKLYTDWALSPDAQSFIVKNWYMFSALKGEPIPKGGEESRTWFEDRSKTDGVQKQWTHEWVRLFSSN